MKKIVSYFLFLGFAIAANYKAIAQSNPIQVDFNAIKTTAKENAIGLGINYAKALNDILAENNPIWDGNHKLFTLSPELNVLTGNEDAFSSINAKISGLLMLYKDTTIAGQLTPNTARGFHTVPISVGIETNNKFNILNGIAEIGYVPWYETSSHTPEWLKHTKLGIFIQGGYKFKLDTPGKIPAGGQVDESKEKIDNAIFRLKGSFGIDTKTLFNIGQVGVGVVGDAHVWYDFLNSEIYYSIQGKLRLYLTEHEDKFFDFKYQKGSGAPNFNQGDQYGLGLTVTF
jgi:hypothetical protein